MPVYRICHCGDIQINCNEQNADRTSEYRSVLFAAADQIASYDPDFVVIAGDIFERYNTTESERWLYATFIHRILGHSNKPEVIVIDGNHDLRKRNLEYFDGNETAKKVTVLQEISQTLNNDRYLHPSYPKLIKRDGIVFACWSELAKYEGKNICPYTPDFNDIKEQNFVVDVFHGTLPGAKDLGSNFEIPADNVQLLGHCGMLGHIHKHQQLGNNVYSSSLVQRSFNEGIRYDSNGCIYDYRDAHGFCVWTIDTDKKTYDVKFVPVWQPVLMTTFVMESYDKRQGS